VISLASLGLFTIFAVSLILVPGADTALVIRVGMQSGARAGMAAATGICTGLLFWGAMASLGLSAILADGTLAHRVLSIVGAAYLVYLGVTTWLKRGSTLDSSAPVGSLYLTGVLANLLNPKVAVFYLSVLPQFIVAGPNVLIQGLLLTLIHFGLSMVFFAILMGALDRFSARLLTQAWRTRIAAVSGGVLIAFGIGLAIHQ
jgi:threonine/homoserine/homoserine lactone efflux protein